MNPWQYVTERNEAIEASSKASVAKVKNPILHRKGKGKVLNSQFEQKKEADTTKAVSEVCLLEAYQKVNRIYGMLKMYKCLVLHHCRNHLSQQLPDMNTLGPGLSCGMSKFKMKH